jgi:hypothetical protein
MLSVRTEENVRPRRQERHDALSCPSEHAVRFLAHGVNDVRTSATGEGGVNRARSILPYLRRVGAAREFTSSMFREDVTLDDPTLASSLFVGAFQVPEGTEPLVNRSWS